MVSETEEADVLVAGTLCLDLIPSLDGHQGSLRFVPGGLVGIGPVTLATGGCVSNTGQDLYRLGVRTRLLGKVGDDDLGRVVQDRIGRVDPTLAAGIRVTPGGHTSYTLVLSPPGTDRMFLHYPGLNDTFGAEDILAADLAGLKIFHFGYPTVMRRMREGDELARLMRRARESGVTTALDTSFPDPTIPPGSVDWNHIFAPALPWVDLFLPSLEEILLLLEPERAEQGAEALAQAPVEDISCLAGRLIEMGAAAVAIKAGERGIYLRTASERRLCDAGPAFPPDRSAWADRELWSMSFATNVVGTTGTGDAAIAGFFLGLLRGMSPEETITAACAVGATCCEAADATSGVQSWEEISRRLDQGWRRAEVPLPAGWVPSSAPGIYLAPNDATWKRGHTR
jgi:sugar/nucleoside kinase (ribokinase family)